MPAWRCGGVCSRVRRAADPVDTIFAVSSGRPPAAIAVIRISGARAMDAGRAIAGTLPVDRRAGMRRLRDASGGTLDHGLVLAFGAGGSVTGEDLVELHCHGGRAVIAAVETALAAMPGLRRAEPGEFTRRALVHGRIDLAEAEGLADLLEAETETQRRSALMAAEGQVSRAIRGWMADLSGLAARVEASLDFADEADVGDDADALADIVAEAHALAATIAVVAAAPAVDRLRDGISVVIGGPPNSGKSTLLNRLIERDAAIVSSISGTTRDRIDAPVVRQGIAYLVTDTAGLTDRTEDVVEQIGVVRAGEAIGAADILLWLADDPPPRADALWLHARADLPGRGVPQTGQHLVVSEHDPQSLTTLWEAIEDRARHVLPALDALPLKRHQQQLCQAAAAELETITTRDPLIVAEHLRRARVPLAGLVGDDATETMLDALFGRFCIGK
nr:tRNA uridine-5-carboxymethylaminomethyl(34) synthesis GTPase MnmE [Sphingomonas sp. CROZ-RG-20F-R02-07]